MASLRLNGASVWSVLLLSIFCLGGCADIGEDQTGQAADAIRRDRRPPAVIFDTDMDFDDASALAYLCQAHKLGQIELRAVTIDNNGAGFAGSAIRNARCILAASGLGDIPVADGSPVAPHVFPIEIRGGVEFILGNAFAACTASNESSAVPADQLIAQLLENDSDVTLITTGPLTNVASAFRRIADENTRARTAQILHHVDRAFIMGGALNVPGNLCCGLVPTFNNFQEFNFWADPASAEYVFDTLPPATIRLVPLDATQHVPITQAFVDRLQADATTPEAQVVLSIVGQPAFAFGIATGQVFWWDPLAAVAAIRSGVVDYDLERLSVVQEGEGSGSTVRSRRGAVVFAGINADQSRFEEVFMETLNGRRVGRH